MTISVEQAKAALADITTFEQLRELIAQLDVVGSGSNTILYSGGFGGNTGAQGIVLAMAKNNPDIRIVDSTDAAQFLNLGNL